MDIIAYRDELGTQGHFSFHNRASVSDMVKDLMITQIVSALTTTQNHV